MHGTLLRGSEPSGPIQDTDAIVAKRDKHDCTRHDVKQDALPSAAQPFEQHLGAQGARLTGKLRQRRSGNGYPEEGDRKQRQCIRVRDVGRRTAGEERGDLQVHETRDLHDAERRYDGQHVADRLPYALSASVERRANRLHKA